MACCIRLDDGAACEVALRTAGIATWVGDGAQDARAEVLACVAPAAADVVGLLHGEAVHDRCRGCGVAGGQGAGLESLHQAVSIANFCGGCQVSFVDADSLALNSLA